MFDAFNNANDKIVNIVCNGNAITNDLTGKIVCDVPVNGNVFLGATVWDVLAIENNFAYIIVFFSSTVCISVFELSTVAHELILPSVCARRAYPRRFLGHVGRTPLLQSLIRRRFRTPSRKGIKNRLYSTSLYQYNRQCRNKGKHFKGETDH